MRIVKNNGIGETLEKAAAWPNIMNWLGGKGQPAAPAENPGETPIGTNQTPYQTDQNKQQFYQLYEQHKPEFDKMVNWANQMAKQPMIANNPKYQGLIPNFQTFARNLQAFENSPESLPGVKADATNILTHLLNFEQAYKQTADAGRKMLNQWVGDLQHFNDNIISQFPIVQPQAPAPGQVPATPAEGAVPNPPAGGAPSAPAGEPQVGQAPAPAKMPPLNVKQPMSPAEQQRRRQQVHGPVDKELQKSPGAIKNLPRSQKFPR